MSSRRDPVRLAVRLSLATPLVALLAACGGSPTGPSAGPQPGPDPAPAPVASLRAAAASRGLSYGCAVGAAQLVEDAAFASLVARECGIVVPVSELKWQALRPTEASFNFVGSDRVMRFAEENGLRMRGHTLVWHEALPGWFAGSATPANAAALLDDHIATVVGRYAGRVHSWDVVNEAVEPAHGRADGLRDTPWLRLLGPEYIDHAFRAAAAADPSAVLVYNENWLEYSTSAPKRRAVLELLRGMRSRGVPVHALGIQAHLNPRHTLDVAGLRAFVDEVAALGLQVIVTEMDVTDEALPGDPAVRDEAVAELYSRFLGAVLGQTRTTTVITWGLSDRYTWLNTARPREDGLPVRALPFDQGLGQKAAYQAVGRSLSQAPAR